MANYTTANLVKAQIMLAGAFASSDMKFRDPAVWRLCLSNNEQFLPDYKNLRKSEKRALEANFLKRSSRSLGSARSHNHTGSHGDAGILTPSFATKSDVFSVSLKDSDANLYASQEKLNHEFSNSLINFMEGLDTLAATELLSNRTGVNTATNEGTFNATNDVYEIVDTTNGMRAVQIAGIVMQINNWSGAVMNVVCDAIAFGKFKFAAAQGAQNSTNYAFQFAGMNFVLDTTLSAAALAIDATYSKGFFQLFAPGTVGVLDWIPMQNRTGVVTTVNTYSSIANPYDGLQYALHMYDTRADGTSVNGELQDVVTQFEISLDVAIEFAPESTATATPVFAFALV
jgi:hypothetical protein